jgi:hypothetical protein
MPSILKTPHLTEGYSPEEARQHRQSVPGMAFFAATGPFGTCCSECTFFGCHHIIRNKAGDAVRTVFQNNRCAKFCELSGGRHGDPIPPKTESCKYFIEAKKGETA